MRCPRCQSENDASARFCEECGAKLERAIARRRAEKSLELRAATSLARLWQQQGKREEARGVLADVYGWFTEGFETMDLTAAKALLKNLEVSRA